MGVVSFARGVPRPRMPARLRAGGLRTGRDRGRRHLGALVRARRRARRSASGSPRGTASSPRASSITSGSLQGFVFLSEQLVGRGTRVLVEAPTYDRPLKILTRVGADIVGLPMDDDGLQLDSLERALAGRKPAFLYTIATFQNPSGGHPRPRSVARGSRSSHGSTSCSCSRTTHTGSCATRERRCRRSSSWKAAPMLPRVRRSRRRSHPACGSATSCLPAALAAQMEALAVSTYISPPFMTQATVHEFLRRGTSSRTSSAFAGCSRRGATRCSRRSSGSCPTARRGAAPRAATSSGSICRRKPATCLPARRRQVSPEGDGLLRRRQRHVLAAARIQLRVARRDRRGHRDAGGATSRCAVAGVCGLAARAGSRRGTPPPG